MSGQTCNLWVGSVACKQLQHLKGKNLFQDPILSFNSRFPFERASSSMDANRSPLCTNGGEIYRQYQSL